MKNIQSLRKISLYALLIAGSTVPILQAGIRIGFGFNVPGFGVSIGSRRAAIRLVRSRYIPVRLAPVRARVIHIAAVRRVQPRISINFSKVFRSKKRSKSHKQVKSSKR